jgi:hypothetical protein
MEDPCKMLRIQQYGTTVQYFAIAKMSRRQKEWATGMVVCENARCSPLAPVAKARRVSQASKRRPVMCINALSTPVAMPNIR